MQEPSSTPVLIDVGEAAAVAATEEISVTDVLAGAFSFAGVIVVVAVVLAVLFAGGLILLRRLSPNNPLNGDDTERTRLGLHLPSSR